MEGRESEELVAEACGLKLHLSRTSTTGYQGVYVINHKNNGTGRPAFGARYKGEDLGGFTRKTDAAVAFARAAAADPELSARRSPSPLRGRRETGRTASAIPAPRAYTSPHEIPSLGDTPVQRPTAPASQSHAFSRTPKAPSRATLSVSPGTGFFARGVPVAVAAGR